ncbi:MAG: YggS family pyridoxal phosphate-dependent enzyme [Balneolaceae bacterium]|nr:YggS family pyridoxal phosphate-dependent enzyme [Balneolaceae bacterium]
MVTDDIKTNLEEIRNRITAAAERSGRDPKEITLIAVSKTKPNEAILEAINAGQLHFGENRMQELQSKMDEIDHSGAQWHMIGTMQSNKIKYIAHRVNWIHSVGKAKYLKEIDKRANQNNHHVNVLIQVNISDEDQKSGCEITDLEAILSKAKDYSNITVKGLMGMARFVDDPEEVRDEFKLLKSAFDAHQHLNGGNIDLTELSMGMSNDFEVAIEEGSTMVRIGSAIFGARN